MTAPEDSAKLIERALELHEEESTCTTTLALNAVAAEVLDLVPRLTLLLRASLAEHAATKAELERADAALLKIAFPEAHETSDFAGNPLRWTSTIAYLALGGRIKDGVCIDDEAAIASARSRLAKKGEGKC